MNCESEEVSPGTRGVVPKPKTNSLGLPKHNRQSFFIILSLLSLQERFHSWIEKM